MSRQSRTDQGMNEQDSSTPRVNSSVRGGPLVIGEALIDIVGTAEGSTEHVGGSPANVAVGLARLAHPGTLLTQLGRDARGERIAAHLEAERVELAEGSFGEAPTSTALATLGADGAAEYVFDITWDVADLPVGGASAVHTGSLGLFLSPGADTVQGILTAASGSVPVTLDPNIRPELLPDHAAALRRFEDTAALADLVKLSDEDAAWLYPERSEDEVLTHLLQLGPELAVLTRGAHGAVAATAEGTVGVPARAGTVVDTIGAGDSVMASLIASLLTHGVGWCVQHAHQVLQRAAAAASITVSRAGAQPPTLAELDAVVAAG